MPVFTFPDDAIWNEERRAVEFGVEVGEYQGRVFVPRAVFQALLVGSPTPEASIAAFHLERSRFERAAEAKIKRRQLTPDGNLELGLGDLREG
ncbi:MAG TPA: DUF1488 family protein [Stellaceae bacterium]|nr:DUF1488 family protein [Stellaceae bacterium]